MDNWKEKKKNNIYIYIYKTSPTIYFNFFFSLYEASFTVYKAAKKGHKAAIKLKKKKKKGCCEALRSEKCLR